MDGNGESKRVKWSPEEVRPRLNKNTHLIPTTSVSCVALQDELLRQAVRQMNGKNWKRVSQIAFKGRKSDVQCLHRWQKVLDPTLVKGPWTQEVNPPPSHPPP